MGKCVKFIGISLYQLAKELKHATYICKVLYSLLRRDTDYSDWYFLCISQYVKKKNAWIVLQIKYQSQFKLEIIRINALKQLESLEFDTGSSLRFYVSPWVQWVSSITRSALPDSLTGLMSLLPSPCCDDCGKNKFLHITRSTSINIYKLYTGNGG
jgi:hypothetical protein